MYFFPLGGFYLGTWKGFHSGDSNCSSSKQVRKTLGSSVHIPLENTNADNYWLNNLIHGLLGQIFKICWKYSGTWGKLQDHVFNLKQMLSGFVPDFSNSLQPSGIVESFQPHFRLNQFSIFPGLLWTNTKDWKSETAQYNGGSLTLL